MAARGTAGTSIQSDGQIGWQGQKTKMIKPKQMILSTQEIIYSCGSMSRHSGSRFMLFHDGRRVAVLKRVVSNRIFGKSKYLKYQYCYYNIYQMF